MTDPAEAGLTDAALDRWIADAEQTAARYQQLSTDVEAVRVTESTSDGLVTVTVDSSGRVTDLRISERALPGPRLAENLMSAMRRAQARLAGRVAELMRETVGEDVAMRDAVMSNYHDAFPAPPESTAPETVEEVRIGAAEPQRVEPQRVEPRRVEPRRPEPARVEPPRPEAARPVVPQARPRRPVRPAVDDEDEGTGSFLQEVDR